jgi:ADP-heptose:LPS heptosyltransferase
MSLRDRGYDLSINFEPDVRSHGLMRLAGTGYRVGFDNGGGGPLLSRSADFDPTLHTSVNGLRLVALAFDVPPASLVDRHLASARQGRPRLITTELSRQRASDLLRTLKRPLVGLHVGGGRPIKQWPLDRFAEVGGRLARERDASLVFTGSTDDREAVGRVRAALATDAQAIDLSGQLDLGALAAVLERLDLLITGDTGPMHLADAVATPVVAVFGLSDPRRYGPITPGSRVVRIDLACSPCNRVRQPPLRCVGHTPDCLESIAAAHVYEAAREALGRSERDKATG